MPVKWALNYLGFSAGKPRLPLIEPDEKSVNLIQATLNDYKIGYSRVIPLLFLLGMFVVFGHDLIVHHDFDFYSMIQGGFSVTFAWISASVSLYLIGRLLKNKVSYSAIEIAVFFMLFTYCVSPVFDIIPHGIMGIDNREFSNPLTQTLRMCPHFSLYVIIPLLAVQVFLIIRHQLKLKRKQAALVIPLAFLIVFVGMKINSSDSFGIAYLVTLLPFLAIWIALDKKDYSKTVLISFTIFMFYLIASLHWLTLALLLLIFGSHWLKESKFKLAAGSISMSLVMAILLLSYYSTSPYSLSIPVSGGNLIVQPNSDSLARAEEFISFYPEKGISFITTIVTDKVNYAPKDLQEGAVFVVSLKDVLRLPIEGEVSDILVVDPWRGEAVIKPEKIGTGLFKAFYKNEVADTGGYHIYVNVSVGDVTKPVDMGFQATDMEYKETVPGVAFAELSDEQIIFLLSEGGHDPIYASGDLTIVQGDLTCDNEASCNWKNQMYSYTAPYAYSFEKEAVKIVVSEASKDFVNPDITCQVWNWNGASNLDMFWHFWVRCNQLVQRNTDKPQHS